MIFSIIIPTFKNSNYLKLTVDSIKKNSFFQNQIIIHVNGDDFKTENYLNKINVDYTKSSTNIGLCSGVNLASRKKTAKYIVYAHDDMYFLPKWDFYLMDEIKKLNSNLFYFSSTQISPNRVKKGVVANHIFFDAGDNIETFNEKKLLQNYESLNFYDLQGSHWAPHVVHKDIWKKIKGFSKEFDPGFGSDPDLNMKLWRLGVRIFKGVNKSRIYHFGSLTSRKNKEIKKNNGRKLFLKKWGITIDFFTKYYLQRGDIYSGPLSIKKNFFYYIEFLLCKLKWLICYG